MMEESKKEIIKKNLDKLIALTICKAKFLTKLEVLGILGDDDVEELEVMAASRLDQARKFYKIILTRTNTLESLLEALRETRQSGAIDLLRTEMTKRKLAGLDDSGSIVYEEKQELGRGSNGTIVFRGSFGNRDVAVKRIHTDMVSQKSILDEVEHLKCCDQHENVIRYFSTKVVQQHVLIALELCDMSLKDWVANKEIDISQVEILRQITVGIEWLHYKRIIHRDLKPENILLMREIKRVRISDFGLSRRIQEERSCVSSVGTGTQGWIAPEILQSILAYEKVDNMKLKFSFASDVFALGCLYYYVLTDGDHVFGDSFRRSFNIIEAKPSIMLDKISCVCVENVKFIDFMISNDPNLRPSLLSCPLFWSSDRRVKFLEDLNAEGKEVLEAVLTSFKTTSDCRLNHNPDAEALSKIGLSSEKFSGCAIPFAYLEYQMMEVISLKKYYSTSTDGSEVNSSEHFNIHTYRSKPEMESMLRNILITESYGTVQRVIDDIEKLKSVRISDYTPFLHQLVSHEQSLPSDFLEKSMLLIRKNADPDIKYKNGSTFLHMATKKINNPSLFNELLKYLVSIKKTLSFGTCDLLGNTVLHYAVENFEPLEESLEILSSNGYGTETYNMVNREGDFILYSAIKGGRSEFFLKMLMKLGARWELVNEDKYKWTVLHYAALYVNLPALKLFISLGANIDAQNAYGSTALHEALKRYYEFPQEVDEIVERLVTNGANVNIRNIDGELPLEHLRKRISDIQVRQRTIDLLEKK